VGKGLGKAPPSNTATHLRLADDLGLAESVALKELIEVVLQLARVQGGVLNKDFEDVCERLDLCVRLHHLQDLSTGRPAEVLGCLVLERRPGVVVRFALQIVENGETQRLRDALVYEVAEGAGLGEALPLRVLESAVTHADWGTYWRTRGRTSPGNSSSKRSGGGAGRVYHI
jgi:hypothetical protein